MKIEITPDSHNEIATKAISDWLLDGVFKVTVRAINLTEALCEISVTELLENPWGALKISEKHSCAERWRTYAHIEFNSSTQAMVTITQKGQGGTDRLRYEITQEAKAV